MPYNPNIHHRRSIRLKGYDYSQAGRYFVTICVQNRKCLFGEIRLGAHAGAPLPNTTKMILNDAGRMVEKWCMELPNKFPDIEIDTYIIMPNHFHAIITNVGAHLCVRPNDNPPVSGEQSVSGEHIGSPLQWFKTMTTNEYIRGVKVLGWQPFDKKLWQRNYYEHVIRNEQSYRNITEYIINNPANWIKDQLYTE
jgi:REP element-mobilizing transposase RayT